MAWSVTWYSPASADITAMARACAALATCAACWCACTAAIASARSCCSRATVSAEVNASTSIGVAASCAVAGGSCGTSTGTGISTLALTSTSAAWWARSRSVNAVSAIRRSPAPRSPIITWYWSAAVPRQRSRNRASRLSRLPACSCSRAPIPSQASAAERTPASSEACSIAYSCWWGYWPKLVAGFMPPHPRCPVWTVSSRAVAAARRRGRTGRRSGRRRGPGRPGPRCW